MLAMGRTQIQSATGCPAEMCSRDCFLVLTVLNFLSVVTTVDLGCPTTATGRQTVAVYEALTGAELGR